MSHFRTALSKIDRADQRIGDLERALKGFLENGGVTLTIENDADGLHKHMMLRCGRQPAEYTALDISEIAGHLRSALEVMTCTLAKLNGHDNTRDVYFPIAGDFSEYNLPRNQRKIRKLSDADRAWIDGLKPYRGGDDLLWALNRLRADDFHNDMIAVAARPGSMRVGPIVITGGVNRPGQRFELGKGASFEFVNDGIALNTIPIQHPHPDVQVTAHIAFRNVEGLHGAIIGPKLREMSARVRQIVSEADQRRPPPIGAVVQSTPS